MSKKTNNLNKYLFMIFAALSFIIPLAVYILTLEKKLVGGDTTWYALHIPIMQVMVPTGYPTFSILGKLFSMIPIGELAYRLNLMSAIFGGLTILLLFLATNRLVRNIFISFSCSLIFAFLFDYWTVANRLEFDTLNSFLIALILFSILLYRDRPERKNLYFFAAALGLSLTNHPIAFFIMPAFLLYVILVKPKAFKSIKTVLLSLLFFFIPLTLYAWLPIRSLQGYGPVTTFKSFFYYITGRNVTGVVHGSSFTNWNIESFITSGKQFIKIIYGNAGIILLLIALLGVIYLIRKNRRFALSSILLIILNIVITILYLGWFPHNYTLNILMVISIYIAAGFLFIYERIAILFDNRNSSDRKKAAGISKTIVTVLLIICLMIFPSYMAAKNYRDADRSEPLEIYNFWNDIFDYMEDSSTIYVVSSSSNIGEFINIYERPEKNINFITHKDDRYNLENINNDISEGKDVYFVNLKEELIPEINITRIFGYQWERMNEGIAFYGYGGEKKEIKIENDFKQKDYNFGDKIEIEYHIINDNDSDIDLTSIELSLSENLELLEVKKSGSINIEPSIAQGMYMWVKRFPVKADSEINIILMLQCSSPGSAEVDFRVTSQGTYFNAGLIEFDISNN